MSLLNFICMFVSFVAFFVGSFLISSYIFIAGFILLRVLFRTTFRFTLLFLLWSTLQRSQCNAQRAFAIIIDTNGSFVSILRFHSFSVKSSLLIVLATICLNIISFSHLLL